MTCGGFGCNGGLTNGGEGGGHLGGGDGFGHSGQAKEIIKLFKFTNKIRKKPNPKFPMI